MHHCGAGILPASYSLPLSALRGPSSPRAFVVNARPGTAEIELLLVIPILLTILLLTGAGLRLGGARLANVFHAENEAYTQVTAGIAVSPSSDPLPIDGIIAIRPGLPNRFDESKITTSVALPQGIGALPAATFTDKAVFLDPAWYYPGRGADRSALANWFDNYVAEDHPADIVESLGLQPPGPP
jgi:hypothetical protein